MEVILYSALAVVIVGSAVVVLCALRHRGPEDTSLVAILRFVCRLYARLYHGVHPPAGDLFPPGGAFILVANHTSGIDPVVLTAHSRRLIRFLMAREYYEMFGLHWFFRTIEAIPVNRDGNDLAATKQALRELHAGNVVGLFPEGEIRGGEARESGNGAKFEDSIKHGAALLALKTDTPIVTAYIHGAPRTESVFLAYIIPSRSRVTFGEPFHLDAKNPRKPTKEELQEASDQIAQSIAALRDRGETQPLSTVEAS